MLRLSQLQPRHRANLENLKRSLGRGNAPSTSRIYQAWFLKFEQFCEKSGWPVDSVSTAEVALFLQEMLTDGRASASLSQAAASISWHFQLADREDPVQHKVIRLILSAAKRIAPPVRHKVPAGIDHLRCLRQYACTKDTFVAWRTYLISLTLYGSCSRLDDVIALRRSHVLIGDGFVKLTLPRSKTDQVRDGREKFLAAAADAVFCPVVNFGQWLIRAEVGRASHDALFPSRRTAARAICKTTYRENLKLALKDSGLPVISSHSWRVGAASKALERCSNVEDVQHFGSWAAPQSMYPYLERTQVRKIHTAGLVWPEILDASEEGFQG